MDLCLSSPKPLENPIVPPSFRVVEANPAKAALETKAVPEDVGARAMLNSISNSKAQLCNKTSESTRQH
jgi:hypothetical protein